jgi:hypothetical protein
MTMGPGQATKTPVLACRAIVPLEGERAGSDRRRPCARPATRWLIWSDGDELPYCGVHAGGGIEASSVKQTYPAVVASAPIADRAGVTIHRPDLWQFVLRRELPTNA